MLGLLVKQRHGRSLCGLRLRDRTGARVDSPIAWRRTGEASASSCAPTIAEGEGASPSVLPQEPRRGGLLQRRAIGFRGRPRRSGSHPQDISLAGIDNIPFGQFTSPGLTTVDIQSEHMGEEGMRMLLHLIEGDTSVKGHTTVEPRLVVRDSTRER
jgi:LacI family transcriptional regulator